MDIDPLEATKQNHVKSYIKEVRTLIHKIYETIH